MVVPFIARACRHGARLGSQRLSRPMSSTSAPTTARDILSQPTWSVRSLIPNETEPATAGVADKETVTPAELRHLLKLCALPLPKTPAEEQDMISTLQSQLHFVRAVQRVDTTGVEPLRSVRDETDEAVREATVGLDTLRALLDDEVRVGHYQRPKRRVDADKNKGPNEAEDWDALSTASTRAGRFFVVQTKNKTEGEP